MGIIVNTGPDRTARLDACKRAALDVLGQEVLGPRRVDYALHEMIDRLREHPDLADHIGIAIGISKMQQGEITDADQMRAFILGFN